MSFGYGIAKFCIDIEEKHGKFWGWVAFILVPGSAIVAGLLAGWLICAHAEWSVGREYPDQPPCSMPHVCDTFHGYLEYKIKDFWQNDMKKW